MIMLEPHDLEMLRSLAHGVARQFGKNCEVVVHEISKNSIHNSIVLIENGHVTGRKIGDGPSQVVLEQLGKSIDPEKAQDHYGYLTKTPDGRLLKSTTLYIRGRDGKVCALFCINFDISALSMVGNAINDLTVLEDRQQKEPDRIPQNVNELLDNLIDKSVSMIGKPVALMTKDDKVRAIQYLNQSGALLITKSGDKIAKHFGISNYTLYSYLDTKTGGESHD